MTKLHFTFSACMFGVQLKTGKKLKLNNYIKFVNFFFPSRDHPSTIKKRFFSVFIVMLISPFFVYLFSSPKLFKNFSIWEIMGLRTAGLLTASVVPLLLTMILFLGPLSVQLTTGIWKIYSG